MESIIIFSGSSLIFFLILGFFHKGLNISSPEYRVLRSLGRMSPKENEDEAKVNTTKEKGKLFHRILSTLAKSNKRTNEKDLILSSAGLKNWTAAEWKVLKYIVGFSMAIIAGLASITIGFSLLGKLQFTVATFIIGYIYPDYWLKAKLKRRHEEIVRTLPDILDLVMVSIEAGLGLDAAIMKVVEKQKGILAQEFNIVLQEIKVGKQRRDALRDMAKKNNVEDLSNVIAALVQADQLGISMGSVLRNQSIQIRDKRKQRAQEQAQKAPVKIMIPLVFFIFPSIFIVILGPAFIQIINIFGDQ